MISKELCINAATEQRFFPSAKPVNLDLKAIMRNIGINIMQYG